MAAVRGNDLKRMFEFVRDQIGIEPYLGELRGSRGALAAGSGNSPDRALLLRDLPDRLQVGREEKEFAYLQSRWAELEMRPASKRMPDTLLERFTEHSWVQVLDPDK